MRLKPFILAMAGVFTVHPGMAIDRYIVRDAQDTATFTLNFFSQKDGPFWTGDPASPWQMTQQQQQQTVSAFAYWADLLTPTVKERPAVINIGTYDDQNLSAYSPLLQSDDGDISLTQLQATLQEGYEDGTADGMVVVGKMDFALDPAVLAQIPLRSGPDLSAMIIHEVAHALGIDNSVTEDPITGELQYDQVLGPWGKGLRDDHDQPARRGQLIVCTLCTGYSSEGFDVSNDQAYFIGTHVQEVLQGGMKGIPVKLMAIGMNGEVIDEDYMSHSELRNSLMSHQNYRNYTGFMEAEIAAIQDLGYDIDRKRFFGRSIYGDQRDMVNQQGYFARNAQGDGYLSGQTSRAARGLGLHIYGSANRIRQEADLLAGGVGGAGIRVDGINNTLIIAPDSKVHANGDYGTGLLVAYGKGHRIVQQGSVQALGNNGIAARFDFGHNAIGDESEYRGSYIRTYRPTGEDTVSIPLLDQLNGPLVSRVDLSGELSGSLAAIYIADNALVESINIMHGARLQGGIFSDYNQQDSQGKQRLTLVNAGYLADAEGLATEQADPQFQLRYQGNIQGINTLQLNLAGGKTWLKGTHQLYAATIAPGATLQGSSHYTLHQQGTLVNAGLLAPGTTQDWLMIDGNYQQTPSGVLQLALNSQQEYGRLSVSGQARLAGELNLAVEKGWYSNQWQMVTDKMLDFTRVEGDFTQVTTSLSSPTLTGSSTVLGEGRYQLNMTRRADAYSQYALESHSLGVAQALDKIVLTLDQEPALSNQTASDDIRALYTALDFSTAEAVSQALSHLSPVAYSTMLQTSLDRERQLNDVVASRVSGYHLPVDIDWQGFVLPFGGHGWQSHQGQQVGYQSSLRGLMLGVEKRITAVEGLTLGIHTAISHQTVHARSADQGKGRSNAFNLGVHGRYMPDPDQGLYVSGLGRIGLEDNRLQRWLSIAGDQQQNRADWRGKSGSLTAETGYRWALNEILSIGPLAGLDYGWISHHPFTEKGRGASRLTLHRGQKHSLHSVLGIAMRGHYSLPGGSLLNAELTLAWQHELLDNRQQQRAHFAGYQDASFNSRSLLSGRDALKVQTGLTYQVTPVLSLGTHISSKVLRQGYNALQGDVAVNYRF